MEPGTEVVTAESAAPKAPRAPARDTHHTCDTAKLKRRYDQLKALRSGVEQVWDQIEKYFSPLGSGGQPFTNVAEGAVQWLRPDVWDSTPIDAAQKLSASIHGSITNPAIRWFKFLWADKDLQKDEESAKWLDDAGDQVFNTLTDSDFNTEIAAADHDLVTLGNCAVVEEAACEGKWKGVDFEAIPIREVYFEQDSKGGVETFYRKLFWTNVQILDMCVERGWECPADIRLKATEGKNLDEKIEVVFCIFEREGVDEDKVVYPSAPHVRPVGGVYFLAASGERLGEEVGYYEQPVSIAAWDKTTGSIWGHGPCNIQLPNAKELNELTELEHQALAKAVDPALGTTERGALSDVNMEPGSLNVFRSKDDVWVIESGAKFDISERKLNDLRAQIMHGLHNDELTLKDSPAMTAEEVRARYELMNRVMGSPLARIEHNLLGPIVMITLGHLLRAKRLGELPAAVRKKYGDSPPHFSIEYQGPLARSQRTDEVAAIERLTAYAAALLKMGIPLQVVQAKLNIIAAMDRMARLLGVPADLIHSDEEAQKAIKQFEATQQRAAEATSSEVEGKAAVAHAQAQNIAQQAAAAAQGAGGPVPAQPTPVVSPAFGPATPFRQPMPAAANP